MNPIERAVKAAGGRQALADKIGVRYQAVQKWEKKKRPPADRIVAIEEATGVPREDLRPDLYVRKSKG